MSGFLNSLETQKTARLDEIIAPNDLRDTSATNHVEKALFIPGAFKDDSPRDRLFFQLYTAGKIDSYGFCISSNEWMPASCFDNSIIDEISTFLSRNISLSSLDKLTGRVISGSIKLSELLLHLFKIYPGNVFSFGSHLLEIANKHHFTLNNLQKLVNDPIPFELFEMMQTYQSSDSDWRFILSGEITTKKILQLPNEVINFIAKALYSGEENASSSIMEQRQNVKDSSLLKFHYFDTRKDETIPIERNTIYSTISFGNMDEKPIDLIFVQNIENPCIFYLDDFKLNATWILYSNPSPLLKRDCNPVGHNSKNIWQQLVDQALNILHCPNIEKCDEMVWLRALKNMTKNCRFFEENIDLVLFHKIPSSKLPELISSFFKKLDSDNQLNLIALSCHILIFLNKQNVDKAIIEKVQEKIKRFVSLPLKIENFFGCLLKALTDPCLDFKAVYSLLHATIFLNLGTTQRRVFITRVKSEVALEISDIYFLQTTGSLKTSIDDLNSYLLNGNIPVESTQVLESLFTYLLGESPFTANVNESLNANIQRFDTDFETLIETAEKLVQQPVKLLKQYGYNLLLLSFSYTKNIRKLTGKLLFYFPAILSLESCPKERLRICNSIIAILNNRPLANLKNVFVDILKSSQVNASSYLDLCIVHTDFSSYPFVFGLFSHLPLEPEQKKISGINLLEKMIVFDLNASSKLFLTLLKLEIFLIEDAIRSFKMLITGYKKKTSIEKKSVEKANTLKQASWALLFERRPDRTIFTALEDEIHYLIEYFYEMNLSHDLIELLSRCIVFSAVPKSLDMETYKKFIPPKMFYQHAHESLKQKIAEEDLDGSIVVLKEILELLTGLSDRDAKELQDTIHYMFHNFSSKVGFSRIHPLMSHSAFQKLYVNFFEEKLQLIQLSFCSFNFSEKTDLILMMLGDFFEAVDCEQNAALEYLNLFIDLLNNLNILLTPMNFKVIIQNLDNIFKILILNKQYTLLISFLQSLSYRNVRVTFDKNLLLLLIPKVVKHELNESADTQHILPLMMVLKAHTLASTPQYETIIETYARLMEELLRTNQMTKAIRLFILIIQLEMPNQPQLEKWMGMCTQNLESFNLLTDALFDLSTSFNPSSVVFLPFQYIIMSVKERQLLTLEQKILFARNLFKNNEFCIALLGLVILKKIYEEELLDVLPLLEETLHLLIKNSEKYQYVFKLVFSGHVRDLLFDIFVHQPQSFDAMDLFKMIKSLAAAKCYSMHATALEIIIHLLERNNPLAPKIIEYIKQFIEKIIINPKYLDEEYYFAEQISVDDLLFKLTSLNQFDLIFENEFKVKIITKILTMRFEQLLQSPKSNEDLLQHYTNVFCSHAREIAIYPILERQCLNNLFHYFAYLIKNQRIHMFNMNMSNILSGVSGLPFILVPQMEFKLEGCENPFRCTTYINLLILNLLKINFDDNNIARVLTLRWCQQALVIQLKFFKENLHLSKTEEYIRSAITFIDILEEIIFWKELQNIYTNPVHLTEMEKIFKIAKDLNLLAHHPKAGKRIILYISLRPLTLRDSTEPTPFHGIMGEAESMIKRYLNYHSPISTLRAINLYKNTQALNFQYEHNNKIKEFADPNKLLDCFNTIRAEILTYPFFEAQFIDDSVDVNIEKPFPTVKRNYIFHHFQRAIFSNIHIKPITRPIIWRNTLIKMAQSWSDALIKLLAIFKGEPVQSMLFDSWYEFLIESHTVNCFIDHFTEYNLILTNFIHYFIERVNFLKFKKEALRIFLARYLVNELFDIKRKLNRYELAKFNALKRTLIEKLMFIKDPIVDQYVKTIT